MLTRLPHNLNGVVQDADTSLATGYHPDWNCLIPAHRFESDEPHLSCGGGGNPLVNVLVAGMMTTGL